jgi:hypothetical protein
MRQRLTPEIVCSTMTRALEKIVVMHFSPTLHAPVLHMDGGRITALTGVDPDTGETATGRAGNVSVAVDRLHLAGGALIDSRTTSAGRGGSVQVTVRESAVLTGGSGLTTVSSGSGAGGSIVLRAHTLTLRDGATISAESTGIGNAGTITITAQDSVVSTTGSVVTRATQADGGNIQVTARRLVQLQDSEITTAVGSGAGRGGNITMDPEFVVLEHSQLRADAFGGPGGNITVTAQVFLADPASQVSASSALGLSGVVDIRAPVTNVSGVVAPLPQTFGQAARAAASGRRWGAPGERPRDCTLQEAANPGQRSGGGLGVREGPGGAAPVRRDASPARRGAPGVPDSRGVVTCPATAGEAGACAVLSALTPPWLSGVWRVDSLL